MGNDLVSVIMLSHGDGAYVVETVRSVLTQTYQNWELLYVAQTNDETLEPFSSLREEDIHAQKRAGKALTDSYRNSRIKVSYIVGQGNDTPRRNFALKEAKGKWIAFLDAGTSGNRRNWKDRSALWRRMGMCSPIRNMGLLIGIPGIGDSW